MVEAEADAALRRWGKASNRAAKAALIAKALEILDGVPDVDPDSGDEI